MDGLVGPLCGARIVTLGTFKLQCRGALTALDETFGCLRRAQLPSLRTIKIDVRMAHELQPWNVGGINAVFQLGEDILELLNRVHTVVAVLPVDKPSVRLALMCLVEVGVFRKGVKIQC